MLLRFSSLLLILFFCSSCSLLKSKPEEKSRKSSSKKRKAAPDDFDKEWQAEKPSDGNGMWDIWGIEKGTITFNNQKKIKTGLSKVKVVAVPQAHDGTRYALVSGKECGGKSDCESYINLYLHRMKDDPEKAESFIGGGSPMPGKLSDYLSQKILQHYRVFWGDCLANRDAMVIWIGWTTTVSKKRVKVAAYYKLDGQQPDFQSFNRPLPKMADITPQVEAGTCHAVPEQDQDTPS